jgi:uncharacterized protein (DUF1015 family)
MVGWASVAEVKPFSGLRYDTTNAGPLTTLVAPPYDVLSADERLACLQRSPYNVVHLTLPESEEGAARLFREWRDTGVLTREDETSFWALVQDYVGPDGVARTRTGLVATLRLEPYERRVVLPHERTHSGPKEGRLRLLRAVRAELEPIFLLYEGERPFEVPLGAPELEVEGARLWRLGPRPELTHWFADRQLLIADGHHRYETALAFHEEDGTEASAFMLVVLVSTADPGLTIFPTHRVAERVDGLPAGDAPGSAEEALRRLARLSHERAACVVYRGGSAEILLGERGELDPALVARLRPEGVTYTPRVEEAVAAVDGGQAEAAFLLRPTRIEDVFAVAERGETMPQKSTYFFPKLLSGLLFQPLD